MISDVVGDAKSRRVLRWACRWVYGDENYYPWFPDEINGDYSFLRRRAPHEHVEDGVCENDKPERDDSGDEN